MRPVWLIDIEYYHAIPDISIDTTCSYSLVNSLTGEIPSYVSISPNPNGIPTLKFTSDATKWPNEPLHDYLTIKCAIANQFTVTNTI